MSKLNILSSLGFLSATVLSCSIAAPTLANPVGHYYGNYRINSYSSYPTYSNWIYGSPIPAPTSVNPVTGSAVNPYSSNFYFNRQPARRRGDRDIYNSILIRPTVINSQINNSVLVEPRIVDRNPYIPIYFPESGGYIRGYRNY